MNIGINTNDEDLCLADSATTHTILKSNNFFSYLVISSTTNIFECSRRATILLPRCLIETY